MAKPDWVSIKTEFIKCSLSQREFAKAKGVSAPALMSRAARERWEEEREQLQAIASSKAIAMHEERMIDELSRFNEDDLRVAKALRAKAANMLKVAETPSALRAIAATFDVAQKIGRLALGANTESTALTGKGGGAIATASVSLDEIKAVLANPKI